MDATLIASIIGATLVAGTPLIIVALGELVTERSGVLNLGAEGMMAMGALGAFIVNQATGNAPLAVAAGMAAGVAMSLLFGYVTLTMLGYSAFFQGDIDRAELLFGEAAAVDVPERTISVNKPIEARAAFRRGDRAQAFEILLGYVDELLDTGEVDDAVGLTALQNSKSHQRPSVDAITP